MHHVSHGSQGQRIEHSVADDLARPLGHHVVPIVGGGKGRDLQGEALVRQLGRLRYEPPRVAAIVRSACARTGA
jgi:hypothetical protein